MKGSSMATATPAPETKTDSIDLNDDIVISGISGKLPESSNIAEFRHNLLNGIDMVTNDARRWEAGIYGLPHRMGKMKDEDLELFDDKFFGVHQKQAELMDPCMRMLLELTHEAIIDAGINPAKLRGTRTGVYIGLSFVETEHEIPAMEPSSINGYCLTGCARAMFANRISYTFDFKGPSFVVDTACSSSLVALSHAFADLRGGRADYALVAGVNLILKPIFALQFLRLGIVSANGACKTFDADADGYARADTCAVVLLQRKTCAKRNYATLLNVRTNTDGFKPQGVTFPDGRMQYRLLEETYGEIKLSPDDVIYVEAHGSGTPVGDGQEVNMIDEFFCKRGRRQPLLLGSVKSNMGHAEPASGVSALAKMIIAMEAGMLPANLHYKQPNPDIEGLVRGRLKVIDRNTPWSGGIVGLNSFGFGGANAHVILASNVKSKLRLDVTRRYAGAPSIIACSGRTASAVETMLEYCNVHRADIELMSLVADIHATAIPLHDYRGYTLLDNSGVLKQEVVEHDSSVSTRPIWWVYAGMGSQWASMAKELMRWPLFSASVHRCAAALAPLQFDLLAVLTESTEQTFDNMLNSFVSIAAVQVALTDLLKTLDIRPDGIIGHSAGELGAAYADGCFTAEQTVLAAYWRGRSVLETHELPKGKMAAVGLGWQEAQKYLPSDCYAVCHNSSDNCTVSGPIASMDALITQLNECNIFVRAVASGGYAFHSKYVSAAAPLLQERLDIVIPEPRARSEHWLSTSVPAACWKTPEARIAAGRYFVNNLISPVLFHEALQHIPANAIIIEIAPHGLFRSMLRTLSPTISYVSLMERKHPNNVEFLLANIGKLYAAGAQPQLIKLLPAKISYPVGRGTPMLNSIIGWDHTQKWPYPKYKQGRLAGAASIELSLSKDEHAYLAGHTIDGRILYPATAYLTLAWMCYAQQRGCDYQQTPIVFEDVVFQRATILSKEATVRFSITFCQGKHSFEICEGDNLAVCGTIYIPENAQLQFLPISPPTTATSEQQQLTTKDIYKDLRMRGYDYSGIFCGILSANVEGNIGQLQWRDNWVSYMDTMLQFCILSNGMRELCVPTAIERVVIDPLKQAALLSKLSKGEHVEVGLPIYWNQQLDVIQSAGVEMRRLKTAQTQRRPPAHHPPSLERYTFVANAYKHADLDATVARDNALTVAVQVIIENAGGALKLKGVVLAHSVQLDVELATRVLTHIEAEPLRTAELAIALSESASSAAARYDEAVAEAANGIRVLKGALDMNCHFICGRDLLLADDIKALEQCIECVQSSSGFLLFDEPLHAFERAGRALLARCGLVSVLEQTYSEQRLFVLARCAINLAERNCVLLRLTERNFNWLSALKTTLAKAHDAGQYVYLLSEAEPDFGGLGLFNCLAREQGGSCVRLFCLPTGSAEPFTLDAPWCRPQLELDLLVNVLRSGNVWGTYRHLRLETAQAQLPVERAYVNALVKGDLSSLRWIESPKIAAMTATGVDCSVYYAPLNFRDVMLATGKLGVDALPGELAYQDCVLGLEFAGRDADGRRIMALVPAKALATSCTASSIMHWPVPDDWSMEEAATVPCVYATVYYALIVRGQIKKGERILIHAGSGGIGQAAISVALYHGLTVYTTVGSQEKREFLLTRFPGLQEQHIGNSRDTSFEQLVMRETSGLGVDLVLNSLAEEKLQASVRCLGVNGRFLEIGKFDLSNNSPLGMSVFLKNTSFHGILLDSVMEGEEAMQRLVVALVDEGIKQGAVQPLPTTVFAAQQIEQAFRYMAAGKHIGKVVIRVREEELEPSAAIGKPRLLPALPRTYMQPIKSYVVIGGLGGFGLELVDWLVTRGARYIVLSSRTGVKTGYQALMIRRWLARGVKLKIDTSDVTTSAGCAELLERANGLAAVGGIFNLAAVLRDGLLEQQTPKDFSAVTRPKIDATKQLDTQTRALCPQLDYFVCFSSLSCGRGNAGQTNYGLANSAMERICERRQADGYPATAIQWGAIGDTGMVIEHIGNNETVVGGTVPQRMSSCLQTLDLFMQQPHPVLASMVVAEQRRSEQASKLSLIAAIANIMGLRDVKNIQDRTTLFDLGMDSLMSTEIKQTLERHFDLVMSAQEIRQLTFSALKQIDSNASAKESSTSTGDGASANKNIDKSQLVFTSEVLPRELIVRLKSKATNESSQRAVFFLAPIEGFATTLEVLAERLDCPAYGLQCTERVPLESIESCARFYLAEIRKLQSAGPYTIVGYSFGCLVAHAIGLQIELIGEQARFLMLDGAPHFASSFVEDAKRQTNDINRQQSMILAYFGAILASVDYNQTLNELMSITNWDAKLSKLAETLSSQLKKPKDIIMKAACIFRQKLLLSESYTSNRKLQSPIVLVKSTENDSIKSEDYGLRQICCNLIDIKVVPGSHRTFLKETKSLQIIEQILKSLMSL